MLRDERSVFQQGIGSVKNFAHIRKYLIAFKIRMMMEAMEVERQKAATAGLALTRAGVRDAVIQGALMRIRPIMMTVAAIIAGLLPIMLGSGTGSEVMRRIAAPMVGGMLSATVLTLVVIPAVYLLWKTAGLQTKSS